MVVVLDPNYECMTMGKSALKLLGGKWNLPIILGKEDVRGCTNFVMEGEEKVHDLQLTWDFGALRREWKKNQATGIVLGFTTPSTRLILPSCSRPSRGGSLREGCCPRG